MGPRELLVYLLLACQAVAFFPSTWLAVLGGLGAISHQEMTEQAFAERAATYFGITELKRKMKDARDEIVAANEKVDEDQTQAHLHCDGETFPDSQKRIQDLKTKVIEQLTSDTPNPSEARKALGSALHTIQDYYSHSNWVELGNTTPNPDLLSGDSMAGYTATFAQRTCNGCDEFPIPLFPVCDDCSGNTDGFTRLTSGYYFNEDSPAGGAEIPDYKCHHGGYFDTPNKFISFLDAVTGDPAAGINKDSFSCEFSPHHQLHPRAAGLAQQASMDFFDAIRDELSDEGLLKLLFGIGPTIAFAIDTTGSMTNVISLVRARVISIVQNRIGTDREPGLFMVVPFGDPDVGPVRTTADFDVFRTIVNGLGAGGGGDCPELSTSGTIMAAEALERGSTLMVFTDADAKDQDRELELMQIVRSKQIIMHFHKLDSNCDPSLKKRADPDADAYYSRLAAGSGGRYFSGPVSALEDFQDILDTTIDSDSVTILRVDDVIGAEPLSYEIPVDSHMTKLAISLRADTASMTITQPDGSPLPANGTDGVVVTKVSGTTFVSIANPVGVYSVRVAPLNGTGPFTLSSTGVSSIHSTFWFASVLGRPGHEGWYPIEEAPPSNVPIGAMADITGEFASATFTLRKPSFAELNTIALSAGPGGEGFPQPHQFLGRVELPAESFYVYISGTDDSGAKYQRMVETLMVPEVSSTDYFLGIDELPETTRPTNVSSTLSSSTLSTSLPYSSSRVHTNSSMPASGSSHGYATPSAKPYASSASSSCVGKGCAPGSYVEKPYVPMSTSKIYTTYTSAVKYCDQHGGACSAETMTLSTPCSYVVVPAADVTPAADYKPVTHAYPAPHGSGKPVSGSNHGGYGGYEHPAASSAAAYGDAAPKAKSSGYEVSQGKAIASGSHVYDNAHPYETGAPAPIPNADGEYTHLASSAGYAHAAVSVNAKPDSAHPYEAGAPAPTPSADGEYTHLASSADYAHPAESANAKPDNAYPYEAGAPAPTPSADGEYTHLASSAGYVYPAVSVNAKPDNAHPYEAGAPAPTPSADGEYTQLASSAGYAHAAESMNAKPVVYAASNSTTAYAAPSPSTHAGAASNSSSTAPMVFLGAAGRMAEMGGLGYLATLVGAFLAGVVML